MFAKPKDKPKDKETDYYYDLARGTVKKPRR